MRERLDRFFRSLDLPLQLRSRVVLALITVPLACTFALPLWTMHLRAPQYPDGLELRIFAHTVEGDVREVNTLNHYIGMHAIDRTSLSDLDWIPFAIGIVVLFSLRVAAIGDVRSLVDLTTFFVYFSAFSMVRFVYRLYVFGHDLDPRAPFETPPFTPAILGTKQIANFTVTSMPGGGTLLVALFGTGLAAVLVWNLTASWREARAA